MTVLVLCASLPFPFGNSGNGVSRPILLVYNELVACMVFDFILFYFFNPLKFRG